MDISSGLKAQSTTTTGGSRGLSMRDVLVVGEIALSGVIIITAGLLVRTLAHSLTLIPGFDTGKNVSTFYVVPGLKGYDPAGTTRFFDESRRAVGKLAGVKRASYAIRLPLRAMKPDGPRDSLSLATSRRPDARRSRSATRWFNRTISK